MIAMLCCYCDVSCAASTYHSWAGLLVVAWLCFVLEIRMSMCDVDFDGEVVSCEL